MRERDKNAPELRKTCFPPLSYRDLNISSTMSGSNARRDNSQEYGPAPSGTDYATMSVPFNGTPQARKSTVGYAHVVMGIVVEGVEEIKPLS